MKADHPRPECPQQVEWQWLVSKRVVSKSLVAVATRELSAGLLLLDSPLLPNHATFIWFWIPSPLLSPKKGVYKYKVFVLNWHGYVINTTLFQTSCVVPFLSLIIPLLGRGSAAWTGMEGKLWGSEAHLLFFHCTFYFMPFFTALFIFLLTTEFKGIVCKKLNVWWYFFCKFEAGCLVFRYTFCQWLIMVIN